MVNFKSYINSFYGLPTDLPDDVKRFQKATWKAYITQIYSNRRVRHLILNASKTRTRKKNIHRASKYAMKTFFKNWTYEVRNDE